MTPRAFKTATLRGLRLYGVPAMLVAALNDADRAGLLSDADWHALGHTPGKDTAYKIGLRPEVCAAHRESA
jgi:hypothetical protein